MAARTSRQSVTSSGSMLSSTSLPMMLQPGTRALSPRWVGHVLVITSRSYRWTPCECCGSPCTCRRGGIKDTDRVRLMTPLQFLERLAALVPPPRRPLVRFLKTKQKQVRLQNRPVTARPPAPRTSHGARSSDCATSMRLPRLLGSIRRSCRCSL